MPGKGILFYYYFILLLNKIHLGKCWLIWPGSALTAQITSVWQHSPMLYIYQHKQTLRPYKLTRLLKVVLDWTEICNQGEVCQYQMGKPNFRGPDLQVHKVTSRAGSLERPKHTHADITYLTNSRCTSRQRHCSRRDNSVHLTLLGVLS